MCSRLRVKPGDQVDGVFNLLLVQIESLLDFGIMLLGKFFKAVLENQ